jgi:hypothetical protein
MTNLNLLRVGSCFVAFGLFSQAQRAWGDNPVWVGGTSTAWAKASNWSPYTAPSTGTPGSASSVRISAVTSGVYPSVMSGDSDLCATLNIGFTANSNPAQVATLNEVGGVLQTTNLNMGTSAKAVLNISDGTLNVVHVSTVGTTSYSSQVTLTGGTMTTDNLILATGSNVDLSNSASLQISSGHLHILAIYDAIDSGLITSWSGRGTPGHTYNSTTDVITITAGTQPTLSAAYHPEPSNGDMNVAPNATLSWTAGDGAVSHTVYVGTNPVSLTLYASGLTTPSVTGTFTADTDYYWRVDETLADSSVVTGPVWKFTAATPRVFWASQPVSAGKMVLAQGTGFNNIMVEVAQLSSGTGTVNPLATANPQSSQPILTDATTLAGLSWTTVSTLAAETPNSVHFQIPSTFTPGVYAYRITSRDASNTATLVSPVYLLNVPQQLWVMGDRGVSATPGGSIRVTGTCMDFSGSSVPAIALANSSNVIVATISASTKDAFSDQFTLPSDLATGSYHIYVSNGNGGAGGWQLCPTNDYDLSQNQVFTVQAPPTVGTYSYTMNPASSTKEADFASALTAANSAGGGTITFPAGSYSFSTGHTVPANVSVIGAGSATTTLNFTGGTTVGSDVYELIMGNNTQLQGVAMSAPGFPCVMVASQATAGANVTVDSITTTQTATTGDVVGILLRGTGMIVRNCTVTGAGHGLQLRYVDHSILSGNTVNTEEMGIECMTVDSVIAENNQFTICMNGLADNAGNNISCYGAPCSQNLLFANNIVGAASGITSQSHWTTDGADGIYFGSVASAGSSNITLGGPVLTQVSWPSEFGVFVVGGRGAGQWRRVVSHTSTVLTLDQPWDVVPDSSSVVSVVAVLGKTILYGNQFNNYSNYIDGYQVGVDYIQANNTITLQTATTTGETQSAGGGHYRAVMPNWHCQYLNNNVQQGKVLMGITCTSAPDVSAYGLDYTWYYNQPLVYDFVCRGDNSAGGTNSTGTYLILGTVSNNPAYYRMMGGIVEDCVIPLGSSTGVPASNLTGNFDDLTVSGLTW